MKKIILILCLCACTFCLIACNSTKVEVPDPETSAELEETAKNIVEEFLVTLDEE